MNRTHKIALNSTKQQEVYFQCCCDVARFTYNWALADLSRAISDVGFGEFRRQLEYKLAEQGGRLVVADRWYPSSKTCSDCGFRLDILPLGTREWDCPGCGVFHDRDINAAINLEKLGRAMPEVTPVEKQALAHKPVCAKPSSMKRELTGSRRRQAELRFRKQA